MDNFYIIICPNCGGDEQPYDLEPKKPREHTCCKCNHTFTYTASDVRDWFTGLPRTHRFGCFG